MVALPRPEVQPVTLGQVIDVAGGGAVLMSSTPEGSRDLRINGVCLDSRAIRPGDLYAALPGHVTHGARFAEAAVSAGAVAVLTDDTAGAGLQGLSVPVVSMPDPRARLGEIAALVYGHPADDLQVLGVTGTNGKTTVAAMVEAALAHAGRTVGMVGTIGVRVGSTTYPGVRTTPEATDLHALLAVMRGLRADSVVMEVSSIALEEHRVDGIAFDVAAFTNLTQDHLDYHGSMEDYFAAKAALFASGRARVGIVGIDDDWGRRLADLAAIPVQTWSLLDSRADWHVTRDAAGTLLRGPDGQAGRLVVPMPGSFNIANAVCAVAMVRSVDVPLEAALEAMAHASVPGRMQVAGVTAGVTGIVDYAHSPDAVERAIRAARDATTGRVIVVLGAGGDRDRAKRPLMGQEAARLSDVLVVTDDNPRSEDPAEIRRQVRNGASDVPPRDRAEVLEEGDRARAISVAVRTAESGDVVLVLGKGHEQGQEVAGVVTAFDDVAVLRSALAALDPADRAGGVAT